MIWAERRRGSRPRRLRAGGRTRRRLRRDPHSVPEPRSRRGVPRPDTSALPAPRRLPRRTRRRRPRLKPATSASAATPLTMTLGRACSRRRTQAPRSIRRIRRRRLQHGRAPSTRLPGSPAGRLQAWHERGCGPFGFRRAQLLSNRSVPRVKGCLESRRLACPGRSKSLTSTRHGSPC